MKAKPKPTSSAESLAKRATTAIRTALWRFGDDAKNPNEWITAWNQRQMKSFMQTLLDEASNLADLLEIDDDGEDYQFDELVSISKDPAEKLRDKQIIEKLKNRNGMGVEEAANAEAMTKMKKDKWGWK